MRTEDPRVCALAEYRPTQPLRMRATAAPDAVTYRALRASLARLDTALVAVAHRLDEAREHARRVVQDAERSVAHFNVAWLWIEWAALKEERVELLRDVDLFSLRSGEPNTIALATDGFLREAESYRSSAITSLEDVYVTRFVQAASLGGAWARLGYLNSTVSLTQIRAQGARMTAAMEHVIRARYAMEQGDYATVEHETARVTDRDAPIERIAAGYFRAKAQLAMHQAAFARQTLESVASLERGTADPIARALRYRMRMLSVDVWSAALREAAFDPARMNASFLAMADDNTPRAVRMLHETAGRLMSEGQSSVAQQVYAYLATVGRSASASASCERQVERAKSAMGTRPWDEQVSRLLEAYDTYRAFRASQGTGEVATCAVSLATLLADTAIRAEARGAQQRDGVQLAAELYGLLLETYPDVQAFEPDQRSPALSRTQAARSRAALLERVGDGCACGDTLVSNLSREPDERATMMRDAARCYSACREGATQLLAVPTVPIVPDERAHFEAAAFAASVCEAPSAFDTEHVSARVDLASLLSDRGQWCAARDVLEPLVSSPARVEDPALRDRVMRFDHDLSTRASRCARSPAEKLDTADGFSANASH